MGVRLDRNKAAGGKGVRLSDFMVTNGAAPTEAGGEALLEFPRAEGNKAGGLRIYTSMQACG